jgi:hypothetical protein
LDAPISTTIEGGICGSVSWTSEVSRLMKTVWAMQRLRALHFGLESWEVDKLICQHGFLPS